MARYRPRVAAVSRFPDFVYRRPSESLGVRPWGHEGAANTRWTRRRRTMTAQIKITYSDGRIEDRVLAPGTYLAGREQGDIVLRDPNTSGRHAQIDVQFGRVTMTDLGSTNGTYDVQGQR